MPKKRLFPWYCLFQMLHSRARLHAKINKDYKQYKIGIGFLWQTLIVIVNQIYLTLIVS